MMPGFSLLYTLTVPTEMGDEAQALLQQNYTNTAGIISYDVVNVDGSGSTLVPFDPANPNAGLLDTTQAEIEADGNIVAPLTATHDTSGFNIPNAAMKKELIETEVSTSANGPAQIVQGELATYEISVRIPANTTVKEGVLFDEGFVVDSVMGASGEHHQLILLLTHLIARVSAEI